MVRQVVQRDDSGKRLGAYSVITKDITLQGLQSKELAGILLRAAGYEVEVRQSSLPEK
jgi:hypothetical protein